MKSDKEYVNVFESLYIGIQNSKGLDPKKFPLSFMTYFDKDNALFKSRKQTIVSWVGTDGYHDYLDNDPQDGFTIIDYETRYSTSNKVFEVTDPRGFKLQISADNLVFLITSTTIIKGVIQEPCVWSRANGDNYLLPIASPMYAEGIKDEVKLKDLKRYDVVASANSGDVVYQGSKYCVGIAVRPIEKIFYRPSSSYYSRTHGRKEIIGWTYEPVDLGKNHVFTFLDDDYHLGTKGDQPCPWDRCKRGDIKSARSPSIYMCKSMTIKQHKGNVKGKYKDPETDRFFKVSNNPKIINYDTRAYNHRVMFFDTRKEAKEYNLFAMEEYLKAGTEKQEHAKKQDKRYPKYDFH